MNKRKQSPVDFLAELQNRRSDAFLKIFSGVDSDEHQSNIPRKDIDQTQLQRTSHHTFCPYKGECAYYSIPAGGERSVTAVWTYEAPYDSVSAIREYLAFYPDRVDAIEVGVED